MLRNLTKKITLFLTAGLITFACLSCDSSPKGYKVTKDQWQAAFEKLNRENLVADASTQSNILTRDDEKDEGEKLTAKKGFIVALETLQAIGESTDDSKFKDINLRYVCTPDFDIQFTKDYKLIGITTNESVTDTDEGSVQERDSIIYPGILVFYYTDGGTYIYSQDNYDQNGSDFKYYKYDEDNSGDDSAYQIMSNYFTSLKNLYEKAEFDSKTGVYKLSDILASEEGFVIDEKDSDAYNVEVRFSADGDVSLIVAGEKDKKDYVKLGVSYIKDNYTFEKQTPTLEKYLEKSSGDQDSGDQGSGDNTDAGDGE